MQQQHEHTLLVSNFHNPRIVDRGPRSPFDTSPRRAARASAHASLAAACMHLLLPPAASQGPPPPHAAHIHQRFCTVEATICGYTIDHSAQAFCGLRTGCRHHGWLNGWHGPSAQHGAQGVAAGCESDSQALRRVLRGHRVGHPTCLIRSRCQSKIGRRRLHSSFLCGRRLHNSERQRLRHVVRRR
jgi:hypothetical protein